MSYEYDDDWFIRIDSMGRRYESGEWQPIFTWTPIIYKWKLYWLCNMYRSADYVRGGYDYKTKKQFIIDELRGKN